ncbi:hypothetical protein DFP72DRAFT_1076244 [Ephemerocybe angulata]|uniref:Uncharacterized protein n=1 Tax=Ephemerocybe angulata TaxID=980116 RepID=A0A8H6HIV7_9AGAR|nr:hypothetical protein DFP72DRAFT_1076244 [Tulosesus angulatus]
MRYTLLTTTLLACSTLLIGTIAAPVQSLSQRDADALEERCVANRRGGGAADDGNELLLRQVVATPQGGGPVFVPDTDVRQRPHREMLHTFCTYVVHRIPNKPTICSSVRLVFSVTRNADLALDIGNSIAPHHTTQALASKA